MAMGINGNLPGYTVRKQNYNSYAAQGMADNAKKRAEKTSESVKTNNTESTSDYLSRLQKQVPYMTLEIGNGLSVAKDHKVNTLAVNPKLLEKMQNDPKAAREYTQRLKDIEAATKWVDNYKKSIGHTVIVRHGYVDENGNFSNFSISIRKDELNEKLRKEAQENAEKQIKKTRENARKKTERFSEETAEKKEKSEKILKEKRAASKDGTIYLNDTDVRTMIEAAKEDNTGKVNAKQRARIGTHVDLQV